MTIKTNRQVRLLPPQNKRCENCHEKNCDFLEYDKDLKGWICDTCRDGKKIIEKNKLKNK